MLRQQFHLPQCSISISVFSAKKAELAVAGGRNPDSGWLQQVAAGKKVYCADAGGAYCLQAGIVPDSLFGDGDSAGKEIYLRLLAAGTRIFQYPPEKDDTDLQLLLSQLNGNDLVASGVWGGRFDHLYSNIFSLLGFKKQHNCQVLLADEKEVMLLMSAAENAEIQIPDLQRVKAVSLLPLSAQARVSISGVYWPLRDACLQLLHPYAISNIPLQDFHCECLQGDIGLYLCFNQ